MIILKIASFLCKIHYIGSKTQKNHKKLTIGGRGGESTLQHFFTTSPKIMRRKLFDDMSICTSIVLVMTISTFKKLYPRLVLVVKPLQSLPQPVASDCVHHLLNQWWPGRGKSLGGTSPVGVQLDLAMSISWCLYYPQ